MNTKSILSGVVLSHLGFLLACSAVDGGPEGTAAPEENVGDVAQALTPCDPSAPFDAAVPAFGPPVVTDTSDGNGPETYDGLTFRNGGNTAYLSGPHIPGSSYDIMRIDRNAQGVWSLPAVVQPNPTGDMSKLSTSNVNDRAPSVTANGLTIYLHKRNGSQDDIYVGTRTSATEFENVSPVNFNHPTAHDQDPYVVEGPSLTALFFASHRDPAGQRDLYRVPLAGGTPVKLANPPTGSPINTSEEEWRPVVSQDGLVLYFASGRAGGIGNDYQDGDIYMATRANTSQAFSNVTNQYVLNSTGRDFPVYLTPDKCTLYFATNEFDGLSGTDLYQLYKATRPETAPSSVTMTVRITGTGSLTQGGFNCSHTGSGQGGTGTCTVSAAPYTMATLFASGPATWRNSCTGNGSNPGTDGVLVWAKNSFCDITF